ncbi:hypothetical protein H6P81_013713 [Aristolochia fimbriata]|uniref:Uncharacterized protein n=1 Tax=Aristolochia fimbriata TaxID=158543 RepID=A0AAV7EFG7_ARIFI|nr:hypothetical protein H6P81_013713 [Aristolochia fimbriata]
MGDFLCSAQLAPRDSIWLPTIWPLRLWTSSEVGTREDVPAACSTQDRRLQSKIELTSGIQIAMADPSSVHRGPSIAHH